MELSYVLPDPGSYRDWGEFDGDLACMKRAGYDAVELQIADPAEFDEPRVRRSLAAAGYAMCAFQTGSTYSSRGNCLCTADGRCGGGPSTCSVVRRSGGPVEVADRLRLAPGAAQRRAGPRRRQRRIREAVREVGRYATEQGVTLAFEPVQPRRSRLPQHHRRSGRVGPRL